MLVPLKINTEYSLLKSMIRIDSLIKFLLDKRLDACSICDDNLYGVMEFYTKCKKNNIKPIIGLEINLEGSIIYLYAINYQGYLNLLKIHTLNEEKKLSKGSISEYLENLKIVLPNGSYSLKAEYPGAYLGYSNIIEKENAYLNSNLVVYVSSVNSLSKDSAKYISYLEAIDKGVSLKEIREDKSRVINLNVDEDDIKTTREFIEDIDIEINFGARYIPKYDKNINSEEFLVNLAYKGLRKRLGGKSSSLYSKRLEYEISVIKKMGFVDYFLIVYDYVLYAKKNNILVGPGRGSAAGSLVSYCLGITNVDPIKYNLLFERFLNPDRVTMPDIDIDFEYTKRGQVIDYVRKRYGSMKVAPIMTFGTLGSKQVIRDVARALEIDIELINKFTGVIDAKLSLKENLKIEEVKRYLELYPSLKALYKDALILEGFKRHISTHAAGVVISSVDIDEVIPIIHNGEYIMTGVTMEYLENLGLLKMDFLALRNLSIIANVLELIKASTGKSIDLSRINMNDEDVLELFRIGDTEGIFQYESRGMTNLMLKLHPSSFSDLVAAVALFRPGAMGQIDSFIRRKKGEEQIVYLHEDLRPILEETYGIIIYQEQVMQILVKVGGYSFAKADIIRRAMSKKKQDVILNDREYFIKEAINRGYQREVATKIYDLIIPFAGYGFNKAHSVSYALLGYQMAYLKAKAPGYFIANLLNMSIGSEIKTKEYIDEAKKKNIKILKPDINKSSDCYLIKDKGLLLPLSIIKNIGGSAVKSILEERSKGGFRDYLNFVVRTYGKSVNKKTIVALIDAGVLDSFGLSKMTMTDNLDIVINYASLASDLDESFLIPPELEIKEEYSEEILREKEFNSYGFYLSAHPVSKYNGKDIIKIDKYPDYFDKRIRSVIYVEKVKSVKTKKGDDMAFITGSDEVGVSDFVVFPTLYNSLRDIRVGSIVVIEGRVTKRFDKYQVNLDYINKVS